MDKPPPYTEKWEPTKLIVKADVGVESQEMRGETTIIKVSNKAQFLYLYFHTHSPCLHQIFSAYYYLSGVIRKEIKVKDKTKTVLETIREVKVNFFPANGGRVEAVRPGDAHEPMIAMIDLRTLEQGILKINVEDFSEKCYSQLPQKIKMHRIEVTKGKYSLKTQFDEVLVDNLLQFIRRKNK